MHDDTIRRRSKSGTPGNNTRKDNSNDLLKIGLKLLPLIVFGGIAHFLIPSFINRRFFRLKKGLPFCVALVPVTSFILYLVRGKQDVVPRLVHCKYNPRCSFLFRYDENPSRNERIKMNIILDDLLLPGDILLRKQENHLDEMIFAQNSYFTHVGICAEVEGSKELQVLHATSVSGVAPISIEEFCNCYEVAVVRFSPEMMDFQKELTGKDRIKYDQDAKKIRSYMEKDDLDSNETIILKAKELGIFDTLNSGLIIGKQTASLFPEDALKVVLEMARSLEGKAYDLTYNFTNFEKLSCIEYVWYCYKCLFPLHQIKVEDFEYFRCITWPVIIPDVFIKNDFFKHVYSSIPKVHDTEQLRRFVRSKRSPLWGFAANILLWDVLLLGISYPFFRKRFKS